MDQLNEGMRQGDLEDMVLPMITIDEYVSKVDEKAIVMGFYVADKDAAEDLNRFIQKSAVVMLDTEVSPAPDQHGYYIVFIELMNDARIVEYVAALLDEVSPLAATETWQMRLRGSKGVQPFSTDVLAERFAELRAEAKDVEAGADETEGRVMEFLTPSDLTGAMMEGDDLVLTGSNGQIVAEFVAIGEADSLIEAHKLHESAMTLDFGAIAEATRITQILGEQWSSMRVGEHALVQRTNSSCALLLRNPRFG